MGRVYNSHSSAIQNFRLSREVYLEKIQLAAEEAAQNGWVLPEDFQDIANQADHNADAYAPGCVPP